MCESFFATLECELLARCRFKTQDEARNATFAFVEGFYNRRRLPRDSKVVRSTTRRLAGLVGRRADVAQPWDDQTGGAGFYPPLWSRRA
jgi:hypothetical protein